VSSGSLLTFLSDRHVEARMQARGDPVDQATINR
jgi:hypothetical protein